MSKVCGKDGDRRRDRKGGTGIQTVDNRDGHNRIRNNAHVNGNCSANREGTHVGKLKRDSKFKTLLHIAKKKSHKEASHKRSLERIAPEHHSPEGSKRICEVIKKRDKKYLNEISHVRCQPFSLPRARKDQG